MSNALDNVVKLRDIVSVKDFDAVGDGVADDTAAIQTAIDDTTVTGKMLWFPDGTYKVTAALTIPSGVGWAIRGSGRGATTIRQATANTPIFSISGATSWGWSIGDLTLDYASAQPAANTSAIGIYFDGTTGQQVFHWQVERVTFDKGYLFIASHAGRSNSVWGFHIDDCLVNSSTSGGAIRLVPSPSVGQPSMSIGTMYMRCDAMTLPPVQVSAANGLQFRSIEGNILTNVPLLKLTGGCSGRIGTAKIEVASYTTNDTRAIEYSDSQLQIDDLILGQITVDVGIGSKWNAIRLAGGSSSDLQVGRFSASVTLTSGTAYAVQSTNAANSATIRKILNFSNIELTETTATSGPDNLTVDDWVRPRISTDNGDADKTLVMGDPTIQRWGTTLTGNKTVTLPDRTSPGCNAFNGAWFRILRDAATPGAFTLTILNDAGATLHTIASGTKQAVLMMWDRTSGGAWRVVDVATL